jgi:hypothetical protein
LNNIWEQTAMAKKAAEPATEMQHGGKSDVIRKILDSGITKPADIIAEGKKTYNVELATGLINTVKQKHLGKGKGKRASGPALDMRQLLELNKHLGELGGSHIALQAITLTERFIAEYGSIEDARVAIEGLEKLKAELK